jgi:hypothetical protein
MTLLSEIEALLPQVRWGDRQVLDTERNAEAFVGSALGFSLTVAAFDIEDQGFPPGSRGYDGAAVLHGTVLHLTRELAETAFKYASDPLRCRYNDCAEQHPVGDDDAVPSCPRCREELGLP